MIIYNVNTEKLTLINFILNKTPIFLSKRNTQANDIRLHIS